MLQCAGYNKSASAFFCVDISAHFLNVKACNRLRSKNHSHQRENSCQNDIANGVFQNLASASRVIGFAIGKSVSKKTTIVADRVIRICT